MAGRDAGLHALLAISLLACSSNAPPWENACKVDADCRSGHRCEFEPDASSGKDPDLTTGARDMAEPNGTSETGGADETGSTTSTAETSGTTETTETAETSSTAETGGAPADIGSSSDRGEPESSWGTCSQLCYDELCTRESEECSSLTKPSAECIYVACGRTVECPLGEYCDVSLHRCHRLDGACTSNADCPNFGGLVEVQCDADEGLCSVENPDNTSLPGNELELAIEITEPDEGELIAGMDELVFRWTSDRPTGVFFVYVFDDRPPEVEQAADYAIWGAATSGSVKSITWEQGAAIEDGEWSGGPGAIPEGEALRAIVIGYDKGQAVSTSTLRSFFVGSGSWPEPGDSCTSAAPVEIPGECFNPVAAFGCIDGACQIICASDLDCYLGGLSCGAPDPESGLRHCV